MERQEERVLVLSADKQDTSSISGLLVQAGIPADACDTLEHLSTGLKEGAGVAVLSAAQPVNATNVIKVIIDARIRVRMIALAIVNTAVTRRNVRIDVMTRQHALGRNLGQIEYLHDGVELPGERFTVRFVDERDSFAFRDVDPFCVGRDLDDAIRTALVAGAAKVLVDRDGERGLLRQAERQCE